VLIYATAELGQTLGGISGGLLYVLYAFSALVLAKALLRWKGAKTSLLLGLSFLLAYVSTFVVALMLPSIKWYVCVPGSILGGLGAGVLWVAQSSYYSQCSHLYAIDKGISIDEAHTALAGYFAFIYLGSEALGKLLVTLIYMLYDSNDWEIVAFLVYALLAFLATVGSFFIKRLDNLEDVVDVHVDGTVALLFLRDSSTNSRARSIEFLLWKEVIAVYTLLKEHSMFFLLQPYQLSFGFTAAFVNFYIDGVVLPDGGKKGYIGLLSSVSVLVAAVIAIPLASYVTSHGKYLVMLLGAVCFGFCCSPVLYLSNDSIAAWGIMIPFVVLYGVGRGVWENTNKAAVADIFAMSHEDREKAYAAIYFFSGLGGAIGYFLFKYISRFTIGMLTVMISILGLIGNHYCCREISKKGSATTRRP
jgi:MFS family permease